MSDTAASPHKLLSPRLGSSPEQDSPPERLPSFSQGFGDTTTTSDDIPATAQHPGKLRKPFVPPVYVPGHTFLTLDGLIVRSYQVCGVQYMMQQPPNEGIATFNRKTCDGRDLCYKLRVVQEPEKARACGAGPRSSADRRPVDPPPVVELTIFHNGEDITMQYDAGFMLYASLDVARPIANGRMHTAPTVPVLTGVAVAGVAYLEKPSPAGYFIFPDLSVRHEGWYRLKFHLFEQVKHAEDADIDRPFPLETAGAGQPPREPHQHEAMANRMFVNSSPFQVFSAKKFPGLNTSTELSKTVADQGCRVRIRREIRQRRKPKNKGDGEDDEHKSIGTPDSPMRSALGGHSRDTSFDAHRSGHDLASMASRGHSVEAITTTPISGASMGAAQFPPISAATGAYSKPDVRSPYEPKVLGMPEQASTHLFPRTHTPGSEKAGNMLPSISQLVGGLTSPRPRSYNLPDPVPQKRASSPRSYSHETALKDGARPDATAPPAQPSLARQRSSSTLNWVMNPEKSQSESNAYKIAGAIEADDCPYEDGSDSEDSLLNGPFIYKRADGTKSGRLLTTLQQHY